MSQKHKARAGGVGGSRATGFAQIKNELYQINPCELVLLNSENVDYIQSEVRSIKREMSKNKGYNLKVESFCLIYVSSTLWHGLRPRYLKFP